MQTFLVDSEVDLCNEKKTLVSFIVMSLYKKKVSTFDDHASLLILQDFSFISAISSD